MTTTSQVSQPLLQAALAGLELQLQQIDQHISYVRAVLGKRGPGRPPAGTTAPVDAGLAGSSRKRSRFSREARARMAEAQRLRWAKARGEAAAPAAAPEKKNRLSPEGRKRIADAAKKRWAAARKAKKAA